MTAPHKRGMEYTGGKMSDQYTVLAGFYDELNSKEDYEAIRRFAENVFTLHGIRPGDTLIDIGCGTGKLTCMLCEDGYDMIGCDISEQMLCQALARADDAGVRPFFIRQDMRSLELFSPVQGGFCFFDGINYLNDVPELSRTFERIGESLVPGAVFVFDVNSEYRYESVYGENTYVYDEKSVFCVWQNFYDAKKRKCDFDLTFFVKNKEGNTYVRKQEHQVQTCFSHEEVLCAVEGSGFSLLGVYSGPDMSPLSQKAEKRYYVIRKR